MPVGVNTVITPSSTSSLDSRWPLRGPERKAKVGPTSARLHSEFPGHGPLARIPLKLGHDLKLGPHGAI